jgi:very-short-patch-repair endonuclease
MRRAGSGNGFVAGRWRGPVQAPVSARSYIVDFISLERRLIIEVDGGQHSPDVDSSRDACLRGRGFAILRFWNNEVLCHMEGVCDVIFRYLNEERPHPSLPPQAGEGAKGRST